MGESNELMPVEFVKAINAGLMQKISLEPKITGDELIDYAVEYAMAIQAGLDVFFSELNQPEEEE
jgi:hypothetical protein